MAEVDVVDGVDVVGTVVAATVVDVVGAGSAESAREPAPVDGMQPAEHSSDSVARPARRRFGARIGLHHTPRPGDRLQPKRPSQIAWRSAVTATAPPPRRRRTGYRRG